MASSIDTIPSTTFLLIRHGETEENALGIMQGQTDTDLNPNGKSQAEALALALSQNQHSIGKIYSSDLKRAFTTATTVANKLGIEVIQDSAFKEISWGQAEGKTLQEIMKPLQTPEGQAAYKHHYTLPREERWNIPSFQDAETYNSVKDRAKNALHSIAKEHPGETIAIFTHSRLITILMGDALNKDLDIPPNSTEYKIHNCGIARFTYAPKQEESSLKFHEVIHVIPANK